MQLADTGTHTGDGSREGAREGPQEDGGQKCGSLGEGKRWGLCAPSIPITMPRGLPFPAPTPQRLCYKVLTSTEWRKTGRFRNLMGREI